MRLRIIGSFPCLALVWLSDRSLCSIGVQSCICFLFSGCHFRCPTTSFLNNQTDCSKHFLLSYPFAIFHEKFSSITIFIVINRSRIRKLDLNIFLFMSNQLTNESFRAMQEEKKENSQVEKRFIHLSLELALIFSKWREQNFEDWHLETSPKT